jgi:hypothetical protein
MAKTKAARPKDDQQEAERLLTLVRDYSPAIRGVLAFNGTLYVRLSLANEREVLLVSDE